MSYSDSFTEFFGGEIVGENRSVKKKKKRSGKNRLSAPLGHSAISFVEALGRILGGQSCLQFLDLSMNSLGDAGAKARPSGWSFSHRGVKSYRAVWGDAYQPTVAIFERFFLGCKPYRPSTRLKWKCLDSGCLVAHKTGANSQDAENTMHLSRYAKGTQRLTDDSLTFLAPFFFN